MIEINESEFTKDLTDAIEKVGKKYQLEAFKTNIEYLDPETLGVTIGYYQKTPIDNGLLDEQNALFLYSTFCTYCTSYGFKNTDYGRKILNLQTNSYLRFMGFSPNTEKKCIFLTKENKIILYSVEETKELFYQEILRRNRAMYF